MAGQGGKPTDFVRKGLIVVILFVGVLLLYHYAAGTGQGTGSLLALGFVILSAYLIGELVEVVRLPHITGYLLAGLFLGPSLGETLHHFRPDLLLLPPFDKGILNAEVISQLALLDTLALPLICLTAGGALRPKEIRKAILPITGILGGQIITMFVGVVGLFFLLSGPIPFLQMEALAPLSVPSVLALGGVAAAISLATSDAATIAIVVSTKARGPMTTNIISVAVLKDVVVVVAFAAMTAMASSSLGIQGGSSLQHTIAMIGLSCVVGVAIGWLLHLYLKYVGFETLLFLVGLIYTMSFISERLHFENALIFIVAGFVASNWSDYGDRLIGEVERLSTPVFVVFFTLAGAKLHLDVLAQLAVFAFLLVAVRAAAFYIGVKAGASLCNADAGSRKYGWMGFVSQAGLAITLANSFPGTYGPELGGAMFSFILAGVAVNEIIGPALLQAALSLAGELPKTGKKESQDAVLHPSPAPGEGWPALPSSDAPELQEIFLRTRSVFQLIHSEFAEEVLLPRKLELRGRAGSLQPPEKLGEGSLLSRWRACQAVLRLDELADGLSDGMLLPVESGTLEPSDTDGRWTAFRRAAARARQRIRPSERLVDVRMVGRYHFSGTGPGELRDFSEALVALEADLASACDGGVSFLRGMEGRFDQLEQELLRRLGQLHLRFCRDLLLVSTFALPSWQRRFGLAFEERNRGLEALQIHWDKMQEVVEARWLAAGFRRDFSEFSSAVKEMGTVFLDGSQEVSSFVSDRIAGLCRDSSETLRQLLEPGHDPAAIAEAVGSLQSVLAEGEDRLSTLVSEGGSLKTDPLAEGFLLAAGAFPARLRIVTDMQDSRWRSLEGALVRDIELRTYVTGYIDAHLAPAVQRALQPLGPHFGELSALLSDLSRILGHSRELLSSEDPPDGDDAPALLAALERILLRVESLEPGELRSRLEGLGVELDGLLASELTSLRYQISNGRPLQELSIGWQSRATDLVLSALRLALSGLLPSPEGGEGAERPVFHKPHAALLEESALYCQLFDIRKGEAAPLSVDRAMLRNQAYHRLRSGRTAALVGPLAEGSALAGSIAAQWPGRAVVKEPSSPVGRERLETWAREMEDGLLVLSGLHWLEPGDDGALGWLCRRLESGEGCQWLLVSGAAHWEALADRTSLPDWTGGGIRLPPLTPEELRQSLLSRHQLSGFGLAYSTMDGALPRLRRSILGLDPEGDWFLRLHRVCAGDLEEACSLWLSAVDHIDREDGLIHMGRTGHGLAARLAQLPEDDLVFLRQVLRNGWTSIDRTAWECGVTHADAASWLRRLAEQGLLENAPGHWNCPAYLEYPLQEALRRKGWLS